MEGEGEGEGESQPFARGDTLRRGHTLKIYKERSKREPRRNIFSQRIGEGGHNRTVKVKRAVARELCTPGL